MTYYRIIDTTYQHGNYKAQTRQFFKDEIEATRNYDSCITHNTQEYKLMGKYGYDYQVIFDKIEADSEEEAEEANDNDITNIKEWATREGLRW